MSPNDALNMLDQAVSALQANRQVHVQLQQAIEILREAIKEEPKEIKK